MLHATIATAPARPAVQVLATDLRRIDPAATLTVLTVGAFPETPAVTTLIPEALGLPAGALERLVAATPPEGVLAALKPVLLGRLLELSGQPVVFLDPGTRVLGPLDGVAAALARGPVALSPHVHGGTDPELEQQILAHGTWNTGLVAVGPGAEPFLAWWAERCSRGCAADPAAGVFLDQRWLDLAAAFFGVARIEDRGVNVMALDLARRRLREQDGTLVVDDGAPLRSFQFGPAFDAEHPYGHSAAAIDPALRPSRHAAYARLCREYAADLRAAGWTAGAASPGAWSRLASGRRYDVAMRRAYRLALEAAEATDGPLPPNPFAEETGFVRWLRDPVEAAGDATTRYLGALVADRPDLAARLRARPEAPEADVLARLLEAQGLSFDPALLTPEDVAVAEPDPSAAAAS